MGFNWTPLTISEGWKSYLQLKASNPLENDAFSNEDIQNLIILNSANLRSKEQQLLKPIVKRKAYSSHNGTKWWDENGKLINLDLLGLYEQSGRLSDLDAFKLAKLKAGTGTFRFGDHTWFGQDYGKLPTQTSLASTTQSTNPTIIGAGLLEYSVNPDFYVPTKSIVSSAYKYNYVPNKTLYNKSRLEMDAAKLYSKLSDRPLWQEYLNYVYSLYEDNRNKGFEGAINPRYTLKHQIGGKINSTMDLKQQIIQLVKAAMSGDQKATLTILTVIEAAKGKDQQAVLMALLILETMNELLPQGVMAKLGAKLEYYKKLKGVCPEGEELVYFKLGGRICKACLKVQLGNKLSKKTDEIQKFKIGRALYKKDMQSAKDEASRDSISINKYNDLETMSDKGHKGTFKNGKWVPDRKKYTVKEACGSKMKKASCGSKLKK